MHSNSLEPAEGHHRAVAGSAASPQNQPIYPFLGFRPNLYQGEVYFIPGLFGFVLMILTSSLCTRPQWEAERDPQHRQHGVQQWRRDLLHVPVPLQQPHGKPWPFWPPRTRSPGSCWPGPPQPPRPPQQPRPRPPESPRPSWSWPSQPPRLSPPLPRTRPRPRPGTHPPLPAGQPPPLTASPPRRPLPFGRGAASPLRHPEPHARVPGGGAAGV